MLVRQVEIKIQPNVIQKKKRLRVEFERLRTQLEMLCGEIKHLRKIIIKILLQFSNNFHRFVCCIIRNSSVAVVRRDGPLLVVAVAVAVSSLVFVTTNDGAHASLEDEQFEDARQSPKLSAVSTVPRSKEELENFDKLNKTFNERINQLNVNESTKGPSDDKALELENDNLNENKKRVVTSQGSRDDSECA
ncbi:hypothetical protein RhiirA5_378221 [Rhizophagus irregularis]|uniref:Uncharacterized protein n=1 Tax=Rhizophagus irregularis TaxID=588596 RepID=A0A2N0SBF1_9GLOM|nr:hypothetical protein RhiirA5_378221 [Rhizophagus irregularis]PKC72885.1 hypothetical protein RhiirA1_389402 [Rhizophagus irregularis]